VLSLPLLIPSGALAKREHLVYFPNTAYELNIYKIYGKNPGKTLMLIGGIQGNEPGGFLSADLYADMRLERGNLIVVPRANFYSIILNKRGANGDMNRRFTPEENSRSTEDKIVNILKELIGESDYLLNLHDGAGYYHPKYINKWRNPKRFGQSIIADSEEYQVPGSTKVIRLGKMAREVIEEVNAKIKSDLYKFHFMNTKTAEKKSPHKEQRKSATYYALAKHNIPAFGVETSKFLPSIDLKVRYHNLVINAFKKRFGIIPESPGLVLDPPVLKYLVISINSQVSTVIKENQPILLSIGDEIKASHIEANYERGLSLDILGYGGLNDYRKALVIHRNTTLIVRKDNQTFAEIPIIVSGKKPALRKKSSRVSQIDAFVIETKGQKILVAAGETLHLTRGDKLRIVDVLPSAPRSAGLIVNFKGFVGDWKNNTGEDRGYVIDTQTDLMKRYSLYKKNTSYEILATQGKKALGKLIVRLASPKMDYIILRVNSRKHLYLKSEDRATLSAMDEISLEEIKTNLYDKTGIYLQINGHRLKPGEERHIRDLLGSLKSFPQSVQVKKGPLVLGRVFIDMN